MVRKSTRLSLSALTAIALSVLAATSASAADVVGKWYGKLDSQPVITINKAGSAYSASLDYPDTTKSLLMGNGLPDWPQCIHKDITRFEVVGNAVHFTIRNLISRGGDTNYERDECNLNLDGGALIGSEKSMFVHDSPDVRVTVTPVALFPTDFATRSQP
jgi:opacity protein-like surface antigen